MSIAQWQWPIAFGAVALRLLAPGWGLILSVLTLGMPVVVVFAPLLVGAAFAGPQEHSVLLVADVLVLVAAATLPDAGDSSDRYIPVMTLTKGFDDMVRAEDRVGKALVSLGMLSLLAYFVTLFVLWFKILAGG